MPYIQLSGKRGQDKQTLVDEGTFTKWGMLKWHLSDTGYVVRRGREGTTRLHRLVIEAPEEKMVDHLNGDKLDNRLSNLRICTHLENMQNVHGSKGYTFDKSKSLWLVRYKKKFYGRYQTEEEASRAYQLANSGVLYKRKRERRKLFHLPRGVSKLKDSKRYTAKFVHNNKRYYLGSFDTPEQAELAIQYKKKEI